MRCFVAIQLSKQVVEKLEGVQLEARNLGLQASFPTPENLHLTLCFLGEKNGEEIGKIVAQLEKIQFRPFSLSIRGLGFLPSEGFARVFYAGAQPSQELFSLQQKIAVATSTLEERPFFPHITLARLRGRKNLESLVGLQKKLAVEEFGQTEVRRFFLKKSALSTKGALYSKIAEFACEDSK